MEPASAFEAETSAHSDDPTDNQPKKKVVEFITKEQLSTNQDTFRTPDYKKVSTTIPHSQRGGPSCLGNRG